MDGEVFEMNNKKIIEKSVCKVIFLFICSFDEFVYIWLEIFIVDFLVMDINDLLFVCLLF